MSTSVDAVAAAPTSAPTNRKRTPLGNHLTPRRGLLMVPAFLLIAIFMLGPIVYSIYLAFTNKAVRGENAKAVEFVALDNFITAFSDDRFWNAVVLTLIFTLVSAVIGQNLLGMVLALLMEKANRLVTFIGTSIVILAWILPEVVAGYLLYTFFADQGSLNTLLTSIGLPGQDWLFSAPILAVSFANIWRGTAFTMLIYSAALTSIPKDVYESAEIDGAGAFTRLMRITIPLMRTAIATNLMLITLQTLSVFGLIFIMTGGGPSGRSQTLPLYMYEQAFSYGQLGYGTAVALILLAIGAIASLIYLKLLPEEDKR